MTTHMTKTWMENGKLVVQTIPEKEIYKREWVGLTDEDRLKIRSQVQKYTPLDSVKYGAAIQLATERALEEKNK